MKKRIISVLLTAVMLLSLFGVSAAAEIGEGTPQIWLDGVASIESNGDTEVTVYITPTAEVNITGLSFILEFENYYRENAGTDLQEYFSYNIDEATFGEVFTTAELGYKDDNISSTIRYGWESTNTIDIDERTELCTIKLKKNDATPDGRYDFDLTLDEAYYFDPDIRDNVDILALDGGIYTFSLWAGEKPAFLNPTEEIPVTLGTTPVEKPIHLINAPIKNYWVTNTDLKVTDTGYDEDLDMYYVKIASNKICTGYLIVETEIANKPGEYESLSCKVSVVKPEVWFLSIVNGPTKTSYNAGETIDTTGLKIKADYSSGEQVEITSGYTLSDTAFYTEGQHDVSVYYDGFTSNTCKFTVTVLPVGKVISGTYKVFENIICNIAPETTVSSFLKNIQTTGTVTLKDGTRTVTEGTVKTGMTLLVTEKGKTDITYNLAVSGDINGDGLKNVTDLMQLKVILAGKKAETDAIRAASHGSCDDLSAADLIIIKKSILGVNG